MCTGRRTIKVSLLCKEFIGTQNLCDLDELIIVVVPVEETRYATENVRDNASNRIVDVTYGSLRKICMNENIRRER